MSSGFITESEAAEARKKRQEEWERVRKPDDPLERPEEPYDSRSLFERLQEQKQKKDLEYEEAHKLKNMIKGLDDDEIEFLDLVDRTKLAADKKKEIEEEMELNDYRNRVASLQEQSFEERMHPERINLRKSNNNTTNNKRYQSQQKLLKGVVVQRKRKISESNGNNFNNKQSPEHCDNKKKLKESEQEEEERQQQKTKEPTTVQDSSLKCVAILPGLGCYNDSTSDENSSDSEIEGSPSKTDMLGRKITHKEKENE